MKISAVLHAFLFIFIAMNLSLYDQVTNYFENLILRPQKSIEQVKHVSIYQTFDNFFEDNVLNFSKHMLKLAIPLKNWVPAPSEVSRSRIVAPKIVVFRPFFGRKWSLTAKPSTFDPIVLYIIGKLCI